MKIESKDFKIKNIFSRRRYIIPDYQRNYSWSVEEEISIFWDDFIYYLNCDSKSNFFIGPMVYKGEDINASEFEVIDGQQRLITFSILLSVIIALFNKYKRNDLSDGLKQYLIFKDEKNNEQLVINTVEPHPFFQKRIFHGENEIPKKRSEKLIEKARIFFNESIENMMRDIPDNDKIKLLEKIRDFIFDIDTVVIVSDDAIDAFTIFETINTRGKDLSSLDLLKNYIFKNYLIKTGVAEPKITWKKLVGNIELERDSFFNRFWASWIAKITENKLYRRFNDYMRSSDNKIFKDANILLDELFIASKIYRQITKPKIDDWKKDKNFYIYYHIKNINGLFKLKVHIPFFLALFEEFEKKNINIKLLNKTLLLMENFHFIFTHIASLRASGLDNKYSKFAIRIRNEKDKDKVVEDLKTELNSKMPKKDEYIQKFKELNFSKNKDTIKFILLRLEKEMDSSLALDFDLHTIEHLEPKSKKSQNVNNIGNLFLLEEEYNQNKDNKGPFEIDQKLKKSVIEILKEKTKYKTTQNEFSKIIKKNKWTESEIEERVNELANSTYNLFSKI